MQKVVQRTTLARNQAARKARILQKKKERQDVTKYFLERTQAQRVRLDAHRNVVKARQEDWYKGALAPYRETGLEPGTYGAMNPQDALMPRIPKHLRRPFINIAPKDRVVVLKGPDQGKICTVISVDPESESVRCKEANRVDFIVPPWARENDSEKIVTDSMAIPIDDVRLICLLEENGKQYEAVAKHVHGGGPFLTRLNVDTPRHTRYISGENIRIPWPEENNAMKTTDEDGDTSRKEVEYETWTPSLEAAPFESSIMDELRNKYSKYRIRHDPAWVEARKLEDLRNEFLKSRTLLTPAGEYRRKLAQERAAARESKKDENGNYIMDSETSDFIAQYLSRNGAGKQPVAPPKRAVN